MTLPRAGALLLAGLLASQPALAHAVLIESTPAANGTLAQGHRTLHLRYNSRIDHARSRVTLTSSGGTASVLALAAGTPPNVMDTQADLEPGGYVLRWQVLAIDGHITRGQLAFTVTSP